MGGQEENPLKIKGFLVRETGLELMAALKPIKPCTIWHKQQTKFYNTIQPN